MVEKKTISGKILSMTIYGSMTSTKYKKTLGFNYYIALDTEKNIVAVSCNLELSLVCGDVIEVIGCYSDGAFRASEIKMVKKYIPPLPPIEPQKHLSDFKK